MSIGANAIAEGEKSISMGAYYYRSLVLLPPIIIIPPIFTKGEDPESVLPTKRKDSLLLPLGVIQVQLQKILLPLVSIMFPPEILMIGSLLILCFKSEMERGVMHQNSMMLSGSIRMDPLSSGRRIQPVDYIIMGQTIITILILTAVSLRKMQILPFMVYGPMSIVLIRMF